MTFIEATAHLEAAKDFDDLKAYLKLLTHHIYSTSGQLNILEFEVRNHPSLPDLKED